MEITKFNGAPTANFVDGERHIPVKEFSGPGFSTYDRLVHDLGDETLGSMGISSTYDIEDLPTRISTKNLRVSSRGAGHSSKLVK